MTVVLLPGTSPEVARRVREQGVEARTADGASVPADVMVVVAPDEPTRCELEHERPDLVGRVHVEAALEDWLPRARPATVAPDARRVGVVGYNLKFLDDILAAWQRDPRLEVEVDRWPRFRHHDEDATRAVLERSDVVLCEWCGPNAVLASRRRRRGQRLVVRLHRFELQEPEWRDVEIDNVDAVVVVGPAYRRMVLATTGWPQEKVVVVPNPVDVLHHDRPKLPSARHTIGMLSIDRSRKRLDRGLDVLAALRATDPRWTLRCKGTSPWDSDWVAARPDERAWFAAQADRIASDPLLRDGFVLDPGGPDVAAWLRGIGFVLSPSDDESFHLAPAEGMASGAVPVLWPWEGAAEVHHPRWVLDEGDAAAAAERIRVVAASPKSFATTGEQARQDVAARYRIEDVIGRFTDVVLGVGGAAPPGSGTDLPSTS